MIFAHLPAGYIMSRLLFKKIANQKVSYESFRFWAMTGAIAPDFDLLVFAIADHHPKHHHEYLTHFPLFWISLVLISLLWMLFKRNQSKNPALALIFTLNGFLHLTLDTLTGYVYWSAPFGGKGTPFSLEPYSPLRPAILEIIVFLWAFYLLKYGKKVCPSNCFQKQKTG